MLQVHWGLICSQSSNSKYKAITKDRIQKPLNHIDSYFDRMSLSKIL